MSVGYREITKTFEGATISTDRYAHQLKEEIRENGIKKIFRYPMNGIPETTVKPTRRK